MRGYKRGIAQEKADGPRASRAWWVGLVWVPLVVFFSVAQAQTPAASSSAPAASSPPLVPSGATPGAPSAATPAQQPQAEALKRAIELFNEAVKLEEKGALDTAIDLYARSRRFYPSIANTQNLAILLVKRERCDEASEVYESLVEDFAPDMSPPERDAARRDLATCRRQVGTVQVKTNIEAQVTIDGKVREGIQRGRGARLKPGKHRVRAFRTGYEQVDREVEVNAGQEQTLELSLTLLTSLGQLQVRGESGEVDLPVWIDNNEVGVTPWSGGLKPGTHLVQIVGDRRGSLPKVVQVLAGLEVGIALPLEPLGPTIWLSPDPPGAALSVEREDLGTGGWRGRLPARRVKVEARAEGYRPLKAEVAGDEGGEQALRLAIEEGHPRWRKNHLEFAGVLGWGVAPSLAGDASSACPERCSGSTVAMGWMAEGRVAYVLSSKLRIEGGAGFLALGSQFQRRFDVDSYVYRMEQAPSVSGPEVGLGLGYVASLGASWRLGGRLSVHGFFSSSRDLTEGRIEQGDQQALVEVARSGDSVRGFDLFVMPEISAAYRRGPWYAGLGVGGGLFLTEGPRLSHGEVAVPLSETRPCAPLSRDAWCVRGRDDLVSNERAHGRLLFLTPSLQAGRAF